MHLTMSALYEKKFIMLPKTNTVLSFNRQYFSDKLQYNTGVAIVIAAQHWRYIITILVVNTISNTGKLSKMVRPDSFCEEPLSLWLRKLMIAGSIP